MRSFAFLLILVLIILKVKDVDSQGLLDQLINPWKCSYTNLSSTTSGLEKYTEWTTSLKNLLMFTSNPIMMPAIKIAFYNPISVLFLDVHMRLLINPRKYLASMLKVYFSIGTME